MGAVIGAPDHNPRPEALAFGGADLKLQSVAHSPAFAGPATRAPRGALGRGPTVGCFVRATCEELELDHVLGT